MASDRIDLSVFIKSFFRHLKPILAVSIIMTAIICCAIFILSMNRGQVTIIFRGVQTSGLFSDRGDASWLAPGLKVKSYSSSEEQDAIVIRFKAQVKGPVMDNIRLLEAAKKHVASCVLVAYMKGETSRLKDDNFYYVRRCEDLLAMEESVYGTAISAFADLRSAVIMSDGDKRDSRSESEKTLFLLSAMSRAERKIFLGSLVTNFSLLVSYNNGLISEFRNSVSAIETDRHATNVDYEQFLRKNGGALLRNVIERYSLGELRPELSIESELKPARLLLQAVLALVLCLACALMFFYLVDYWKSRVTKGV